MQANPMSWTMQTHVLMPGLVPPYVAGEAVDGARQRCQRCDILLGSYHCPNPLCEENHGQHVGNLCSWCYDTAHEVVEYNGLAAWIMDRCEQAER